ncbi:MAG: biopolymer transporter ExbD, partial [Leptolyngbyaceae cyanobacterium bins.59]|nr:biopolymer transporter ExbD [Leptolyngbyaceae cyanobacterium bins.59]
MKIHQDSPPEEVQIQIVPLIDVIFCILVFFILASLQLTRQQAAISVDLPTATTGVPQQRDMILVSVSNGVIYIDQQPVTLDQLRQQLVGYRQLNPNGLMVLYAPKDAVYAEVVQVLDVLRSVGGDRVALATRQEAPDAATPITPGLPTTPGSLPGTTSPYPLPGSSLPGSSLPGSS